MLVLSLAGACFGNALLAREAADAPREVPGRILPVPETVSPQMTKLIARAAMRPVAPQSPQEWKATVEAAAVQDLARITELRKQFAVTVEATRLGGVPCFTVTPAQLPQRNQHRVLLHLHGGGRRCHAWLRRQRRSHLSLYPGLRLRLPNRSALIRRRMNRSVRIADFALIRIARNINCSTRRCFGRSLPSGRGFGSRTARLRLYLPGR